MIDIVEQLRALARAEHDDLSVADEAADTIEQLRARIAELEAEKARLRAMIENCPARHAMYGCPTTARAALENRDAS